MFDSGSEGNYIYHKWTTFEKNIKTVSPTSWITGESIIITKRECNLIFKFDEFSNSQEVEWNNHVNETEMSKESLEFDTVIGLDLLCKLGLIINYETKVVD